MPELATINAFGDPLYHTLCPSNIDVREYLAAVVKDLSGQGAQRIELEAMQCGLGDLDPDDLAELAFRVDLPELQHIALRLEDGLERQGREFADMSAEELAALLDLEDSEAAVNS